MLEYNETTTYAYNLDGAALTRATPYDTDTITYSPGGQPVGEKDSLAGDFTATYNPDGTLQTETYPDGTLATYGIDSEGSATQLTYTNSNWADPITDSVTVDAAGDWSTESVLNDSKSYTYDNADRLTSVQDTDAGSCTTRSYSYDADSNRTGLTTYGPATGGACQSTTAASTETYDYDSADRLVSSTESGTTSPYAYDTQGDVSTTPSIDAGGTGNLTAGYFANGMLATQTQGSTTDTYTLDGTLDRYATQEDSATGYTTVNDYSGVGSEVAWSTTNGSWTANVFGLNGGLDAQVTQSGTVTLELTDLHGDVLATVNPASDSAPSATYTYTEFGSPEAGSQVPGGYGYLGARGIESSGLGDNLLMGVRGYDSSLGRFDSTDPVFEGSANAYDYGRQNPLTNADTSGMWTISTWYGSFQVSGSSFYFLMSWSQTVSLHQDSGLLISAIAGAICSWDPLMCAILGAVVYIVLNHMIPTKARFSLADWKFTWGWDYAWGIPVWIWFHYDGSHIFY